jgi:hypothetical protein
VGVVERREMEAREEERREGWGEEEGRGTKVGIAIHTLDQYTNVQGRETHGFWA